MSTTSTTQDGSDGDLPHALTTTPETTESPTGMIGGKITFDRSSRCFAVNWGGDRVSLLWPVGDVWLERNGSPRVLNAAGATVVVSGDDVRLTGGFAKPEQLPSHRCISGGQAWLVTGVEPPVAGPTQR